MFKAAKSTLTTETVDLGELGSFKLKMKRPKWADVVTNENLTTQSYIDGSQAYGQRIEHQIRATVEGWGELVDEAGNAIAFSFDALAAIMADYPDVFNQVSTFANQQFTRSTLTETERKNLKQPSSDTSEEASTDSTQSSSPKS